MIRDERGENLIELLVSVAIIAVVITAFLAAVSTGAFNTARVRRQVTAENLARAQLELIKDSPYCTPEITTTTRTVTIQPGPEQGKDTYISSHAWRWNTNYGKSTKLVTDSGIYGFWAIGRSLLQFDLASIPNDATVDSAVLSLYLYYNEGSEDEVKAHRLKKDWVEGTGGENAGATWWQRYNGTDHPWSTPGGDYDSAVAGSFVASGTGWKTMDLTSLTQAWVDGTHTNYGVILHSPASETPGKEKNYYSSDYSTDTSLRPLLDVTYTTTTTVQCYPLVEPPRDYGVIAVSSVITTGLEAITVTVSHNGEAVFTIGNYKADQ